MNKLLRPPLLSRCIWIVQSCSDFPCSSVAKESACNAGDLGSIPELGRSPGGGNDNPLQYSCLRNSMDRGVWGGYSPQGLKELDTTE